MKAVNKKSRLRQQVFHPGLRILARNPLASMQRQQIGVILRRGASTGLSSSRPKTRSKTRPKTSEVAGHGVSHLGKELPYRRELERSFSADLSRIRLHQDPVSRAACESMGAEAYTFGEHIAVRDKVSPGLVAHEAAHAVQQLPVNRSVYRRMPITSAARLEGEANNAAQAFISGRTRPIKHAARAGIPQFFRMKNWQQKRYPKTTRFVRYELPKDVNDAFLLKAINEAARNTGRKARKIKPDFKWNAGPLVLIKRQRSMGAFAPGTRILKISKKKIAKLYEKNPTEPNEMALETTILHEYVHFLGDKREKQKEEWGAEFEEKLFGISSPSFKYFNRAWFGFGKWEVKVISKNAMYRQRFTIKDASSGNGSHPGKPGASVVQVTKKLREKPRNWQIVIEHKSPKGWKVSRIRMNNYWQSIIGNHLIRSEDKTDRDFNDLVLQVRRISTAVP